MNASDRNLQDVVAVDARDEELEKGMALFRQDEGVVDARGKGAGRQPREMQETVQRSPALQIQVQVHAAEVVEEEISQDVCALDGLRVAHVVAQEVWVVGRYELRCGGICPQVEGPVFVEVLAACHGVSVAR